MTSDSTDGIKLAHLNTITGEITKVKTVANIISPNFLDIDTKQNRLFSVSEKYQGSKTNYFVNMFKIDKATSGLHFITQEKVYGKHPCYISFSPKQNKLMTANYFSGNNSFFSVSKNTISFTKLVEHYGTGPVESRQEEPHAHSIKIGPNNKYAYSADLGADKIYIFDIEDDQNSIVDSILCAPGSGPRHIDFSPDQKVMAITNELSTTITVYSKDHKNIYNKLIQTISTVPDTFSGSNFPADIHFSKDGKFVYASNRGYNSLVVYQYVNGKLEVTGWETDGINWPRNFAIDPSDKYVLIANQNGNDITIYKRDLNNGLLHKLDNSVQINSPVCIKFIED